MVWDNAFLTDKGGMGPTEDPFGITFNLFDQ